MADGRKSKISISLAADVLAAIDREAKVRSQPRSAVIESWLRSAARRNAEAMLASEVIAYYDSLTAEERHEDERVARALSHAAKRIDYDGGLPSAGKRAVTRSTAARRKRGR